MPVTVKHGSKKRIAQMKELWREVFKDSDEFIDTFFASFYRPSRAFLAFEDKELVSMLYYMDVNLKYFGKRIKCAYLYGVATKLSERRQGHFRTLHSKLIEELRAKKYEAVVVIPANEGLFSLYKDMGYTVSFKRFEYKLLTQDITEVTDIDSVWLAKKEIHKHTRTGISLLETQVQFKESRKEHKFFLNGDTYLAFAPSPKGYVLYETLSPNGESPPVEQVHYERSALLLDLTDKIDPELAEKQKPQLSYLLN